MRARVFRLILLGSLVALMSVLACSSESTLVGEGACEGYCFKLVGAKCKASPTREQCLDECLFHQADCTREWNDWLRCSTIDATIACDSATTRPKVVGCDKFDTAQQKVCTTPYVPPLDAGSVDAP